MGEPFILTLLQWHNDLDPSLGVRLGDYLLSYLEDELRRWGNQGKHSRRSLMALETGDTFTLLA